MIYKQILYEERKTYEDSVGERVGSHLNFLHFIFLVFDFPFLDPLDLLDPFDFLDALLLLL